MANTKFINNSVNLATDEIQDLLDLFYEIQSIEFKDGKIEAALELSDTPSTTAQTVKCFIATEIEAETQINAYKALGYSVFKIQDLGDRLFVVMTLNGAPLIYRAFATQDGAGDPILKMVKNTIGIEPSISKASTGSFTFEFSGFDFTSFSAVFIKPDKRIEGISQTLSNYINLYDDGDGSSGILVLETKRITYGTSSVSTDNLLTLEEILIECYN